MASEQQQIDFLIRAGIMPSTADLVVRQAVQRNHKRLRIQDALPMATITQADIRKASDRWLFDTTVPNRIKLILDAKEV